MSGLVSVNVGGGDPNALIALTKAEQALVMAREAGDVASYAQELAESLQVEVDNLDERTSQSIGRLLNDVSEIMMELALLGLINTDDMQNVVVDHINSEDDVIIHSGIYADGKVYI